MNQKYKIFFTGFKGENNSSRILVKTLSNDPILLTNSFGGLKKDIGNIKDDFDLMLMFGCDKELKDSVRIERFAEKNGEKIASAMDLENISENFEKAGIRNIISESPGYYLCNEAYWCALQRFNRKAVLIHIPTIKNTDEDFISKMRKFVSYISRGIK